MKILYPDSISGYPDIRILYPDIRILYPKLVCFGYHFLENFPKTNTKCQAKKYIKEQIHSKAFENLQAVQKTHSKVKDIKYTEYKMQNYLKNSKMKYEEATILFALRSQTVKDIKLNTKTFSQNDKMCPLCLKFEDTQKHCIECPKLKSVRHQFKDDIKYDHIFSNCELEQKVVASLFFNIRKLCVFRLF